MFLQILIAAFLQLFIIRRIYLAAKGRKEARRLENRLKKDRSRQREREREIKTHIAHAAGVRFPKKQNIANGWYNRMKKH